MEKEEDFEIEDYELPFSLNPDMPLWEINALCRMVQEIEGTPIGNELSEIQAKWFHNISDFFDHKDEIRHYDVSDSQLLQNTLSWRNTSGYTKDEDGKLIIEPREVDIVKCIYREYLEGQSFLQIGRSFERDGILTGAGRNPPQGKHPQRYRVEEASLQQLRFVQHSGMQTLRRYFLQNQVEQPWVQVNGMALCQPSGERRNRLLCKDSQRRNTAGSGGKGSQ